MAPRTRDCYQTLSPKKRNFIFPGVTPKSQEPFRHGDILCDISQKKWKLGRCIGVGAFGEVYLASDDLTKQVTSDAPYVIKVEPHSNGPLFVEMNFYLRATKDEAMDKWKNEKRAKYLGVPKIHGFGSHTHKNDKYRFIIIPRLGDTVHKMFIHQSSKFHIKTAFTLASHLVDILEYIHSQGYVHLDIKGANMLLNSNSNGAPLFLVDYGLATRYTDLLGNHKEFQPDRRKAEAGTLEYISRDAHLGAMSRRSDLESLGYNLVHWLTGSLPWLNAASSSEVVSNLKNEAMTNIKAFLTSSFKESPPPVLTEFLQYVDRLNFKSEPDYNYCRGLFSKAIRDSGFLDDKLITFDSHAKLTSKLKKRKAEIENTPVIKRPKLKKRLNTPSRRPFRSVVQNTITARVTRNQVDAGIKLRSSREFDWATVLAGHPEAKAHKPKKEKTVRINDSVSSRGEDLMSAMTKRVQILGKAAENFNNAAIQPEIWSEKKSPKFWEDSLRNPTPAMLKIINSKHCRRQSERRNKTDSIGPRSYYTPAMEEVIAKRQSTSKQSPKILRSSSRKTARKSADAIFACARF